MKHNKKDELEKLSRILCDTSKLLQRSSDEVMVQKTKQNVAIIMYSLVRVTIRCLILFYFPLQLLANELKIRQLFPGESLRIKGTLIQHAISSNPYIVSIKQIQYNFIECIANQTGEAQLYIYDQDKIIVYHIVSKSRNLEEQGSFKRTLEDQDKSFGVYHYRSSLFKPVNSSLDYISDYQQLYYKHPYEDGSKFIFQTSLDRKTSNQFNLTDIDNSYFSYTKNNLAFQMGDFDISLHNSIGNFARGFRFDLHSSDWKFSSYSGNRYHLPADRFLENNLTGIQFQYFTPNLAISIGHDYFYKQYGNSILNTFVELERNINDSGLLILNSVFDRKGRATPSLLASKTFPVLNLTSFTRYSAKSFESVKTDASQGYDFLNSNSSMSFSPFHKTSIVLNGDIQFTNLNRGPGNTYSDELNWGGGTNVSLSDYFQINQYYTNGRQHEFRHQTSTHITQDKELFGIESLFSMSEFRKTLLSYKKDWSKIKEDHTEKNKHALTLRTENNFDQSKKTSLFYELSGIYTKQSLANNTISENAGGLMTTGISYESSRWIIAGEGSYHYDKQLNSSADNSYFSFKSAITYNPVQKHLFSLNNTTKYTSKTDSLTHDITLSYHRYFGESIDPTPLFEFIHDHEIHGHVYLDSNENNLFDEQDIPIQDAVVTLSNNYRVFTNTKGFFEFRKLKSDQYKVQIDTDSFRTTAKFKSATRQFANLVANNDEQIDFMLTYRSNVSGYIFNDLNLNGIKESHDLALANITLYYKNIGDGVQKQVQAPYGKFEIMNLPHGTFEFYYDPKELPPGIIPLSPMRIKLDIKPNDIQTFNFACKANRSISGRIYQDKNGNRLFDDGDVGLVAMTLSAETSQGNIKTKSGPEGQYIFRNLPAGKVVMTLGTTKHKPKSQEQTVTLSPEPVDLIGSDFIVTND